MLSIIVPVLNEEESLVELHRQITAICEAEQIKREIIFIDDGSTDQSWQIIAGLSGEHAEVSGIRFRRNFGKAAALTAGMESASGECIMMMDADLQDDPAEIPHFLAEFHKGFDVVNGWKQRRLDPWHKVYPSKVFNGMIGWLTGLKLHDHNCGIKLFDQAVAEEIQLYGERHRFIPVLANAQGFSVTEIPVNHRPREFGHSKYGVIRFLRGFLDLLTIWFLIGFGQRPQHMLGAIGLICFGFGLIGIGYLTVLWFLMNIVGSIPYEPIGTRPLLNYSMGVMILGAQAMSLGLIAELMVAATNSDRNSFSVKERVGKETA